VFGCRNFRVTICALGGKTLLVELALQIRREHRLRAWETLLGGLLGVVAAKVILRLEKA
jgi:hypothetical protein